jgi:hypothetical protein
MGYKIFRRMVCAAVLCACCFLAAASLAPGAAAQDQPAAADSGNDKFVSLKDLSATQMSPEDTSLVDKKQREIEREAEFFGYELGSGSWTHDQVMCPDMPEYLILHYRSRSQVGVESLFTAIVPREPGRVMVVPVLFRNATPFHAAAGSQRSMTVFNQAVPKEIAEKAVQEDGPWLRLGMCYAAIAGAEPQVPERMNTDIALARAPVPTLRMGTNNGSREILFSDRNDPGQYMVWSITLTNHGRVTAASARTFADYKARRASEQSPPEKIVHPGSEPPAKIVQPEKQPKETEIPQ